MKKGNSFNRRIFVTASLVNLAFWMVACLAAAFVMYEEYEEAFDGALRLSATRLLPMAVLEVENRRAHGYFPIQPAPVGSPEYSTYQLIDRHEQVLLRSQSAPDLPYGVPLETGFFRTDKWRIYSLASADGAFFIQVGDRISERREAAFEALAALIVPVVFFIPLTMLAMMMLLKRQLRPITHLSTIIAKKDSGNMQPIEDVVQREFQPIINSVNHLLERLQSALQAERHFTANSAHELRTPIAGALAHTQLLLSELPRRYQSRAAEVERALQRLRHLSEKLLQLARADALIGQSDTPCNLLVFIEAILEDFRRLGANKRLIIKYETHDLVRQVNGDAFGIIMRNLLENALTYSPENSPVTVTISSNAVTISNDCVGLPAEKQAQLGKRFYRGSDQGKGQGAGLGLSIVEGLLRSMPISIAYQSPIDGQGRGFRVTLTL